MNSKNGLVPGGALPGNNVEVRMHNARDLLAAAQGRGHWDVTCRDKEGNIKWVDSIENIVVNAGLDYLLDTGLSGGTAITSWFVGLTDGTPTVAAGDIMSSHVGWVEVVAYSEATREAWTDGGVSGQSVDNSASVASFSINGTTTVGGAFLTSVSTKSGTTGTLYAAGAFTGGDRSLVNGDTLDVTATFTQAAA